MRQSRPTSDDGAAIEARDSLNSELLPEAAVNMARHQTSSDAEATHKRSHGSAFRSIYRDVPLPTPNHFRLIELHPGTEGDALRANLVIREPDRSYTALSYLWKDMMPGVWVKIQSSTNSEDIEISASLFALLLRVRDTEHKVYLWADALCINYRDPTEKGRQIALMTRIYNDASIVSSWLGEGDDTSQLAFDFVERLMDLKNFDRFIQDQEHADEWRAFEKLLTRPYFTRRWIVHNVALAQGAVLYCGRHSISWTTFATAVMLLGARTADIAKLLKSSMSLDSFYFSVDDIKVLPAYRLVLLVNDLFRKIDGTIVDHLLPLDEVVSMLAPFETSNPHDTVYAAFSLSKDTRPYTQETPEANNNEADARQDVTQLDTPVPKRARVAPDARPEPAPIRYIIDYNRPFLEVCKDFLKFAFERTQSLDMICRPWAPKLDAEAGGPLPSWICTLPGSFLIREKLLKRVRADPLVGSTGTCPYSAGGSIRATHSIRDSQVFGNSLSWSIGHHSLRAQGFVLDIIKTKALPAQQGSIPSAWRRLVGWNDVTQRPPDAFWRTIVADRDADRKNPPAYYWLACQYAFDTLARGEDLNTEGLLLMDGANQTSLPTIVTQFLRRVLAVVWSRRLVLTKTHERLSLAPENAKKKDIICVLAGGSVPFLLRACEGGWFELVGECYVHGMMDGEALQWRADKGVPWQMFEIR